MNKTIKKIFKFIWETLSIISKYYLIYVAYTTWAVAWMMVLIFLAERELLTPTIEGGVVVMIWLVTISSIIVVINYARGRK